MRAILRFTLCATLLFSATAALAGQDAVPWARSIEEAQQIAAQQDRLVLIHFYGDNCPPCRALDANVFPKQDFARGLTANYVPVKINGSRERQLAEKYGVRYWPVDVVITPDGSVLTRPTVSPKDPAQYLASLDQVAAQHKARAAAANNIARETQAQIDYAAKPASHDAPMDTGRYGSQPANTPGTNPYAPRGAATETNKFAGAPQRGQYDPRGYETPRQPTIDRSSSFEPAVEGQAYVEGTPYRDPRAATSAPRTAAAPARDAYGRPAPTDFAPAADSRGVSQSEAADAVYGKREAADAQARFAAPRGAQDPVRNVEPVTQPREERPQWTSNPNVGGVGAPGRSPVEVATRDVAPPRDVRREAQAPAPTAAAANPPIGLEGFCPVSITEGTKWTKGDVRFGAIHRGRTYLFGSAAEQQKFLANPDKYSPMLSGFDVVKYIEQGTLVDGKRNHGIVHQGHMYLFTDEASLTKFCENPNTYIPPVQQAMQRAATRR